MDVTGEASLTGVSSISCSILEKLPEVERAVCSVMGCLLQVLTSLGSRMRHFRRWSRWHEQSNRKLGQCIRAHRRLMCSDISDEP